MRLMKGFAMPCSMLLGVLSLFTTIGRDAKAQTTTFNFTGGMQTYTVPAGVTKISVDAYGAQGGGTQPGGLGARIKGDFTVTPGQVFNVVVGGQGKPPTGATLSSGGGGGGSFVYPTSGPLLVAAGGGGGKCSYTSSLHAGAAGQITINGAASSDNRPGGVNGAGGSNGIWNTNVTSAGGGAGWTSAGIGGGSNQPSWAGGPALCLTNGASGCGGAGGYGGGGGGGNLYGGGGGGGGFSGGGGGGDPYHGGGGGSYNGGTNQINTAGARTGNGQVVITVLVTPGTGLHFDGANDYVQAANAVSSEGDFTWEAWIKTSGDGTILSKSPATGGWTPGGKTFFVRNGKPSFDVGWVGFMETPLTYNDGNWHHVALTATKDVNGTADAVTIYVDGASVATRSDWDIDANSEAGLVTKIGYTNSDFPSTSAFSGSIDEVRMWTRALCASEIQNYRNGELSNPTTQNGLALYYKLNSGNVNFDNTAVTTAVDASANGNTGTLMNFGLTGSTSNWTLGTVSGTAPAFVSSPASISAPSGNSFCQGGSVTLNASAGTAYQWNLNGSAIAGANASTYVATQGGGYSVTITTECGVTTSAITMVTVNALPIIAVSANSPVSAGGTIALSATGAAAYSWTGPNAFTATGANATVTNATPAASGVYTVTGTDGNGCSNTKTVTVSVLAGPAGINSGILTWLDASDVDADGNSANDPAGNAGIATWMDRSGNANNATQLNSAGIFRTDASSVINNHPVIRFSGAQNYKFSNIDIRAISKPDVTIITVYKQGNGTVTGLWGNDNANWDRFMYTAYGGQNGIASRGPGQNPPNTTIIGSGVPGKTYLFTGIYDGNVVNGVNNGPVNGSSFYFNGSLLGNFTDRTDASDAQTTLRLGFDGDDGYFVGDVAEFIVYDRVLNACEIQQINAYLSAKYGVVFSTAAITAATTTACAGNSVSLTASAGTAYQWKLDGVAIAGANSQTYAATVSGDYTVDVTSACGVNTSAVTTVTIKPVPVVTITPSGSTSICQGQNLTLTAGGAASYSWTGGTASAVRTVSASGTYTVTGTTDGCSATASTSVTVNALPSVSIASNSTQTCNGVAATLTATATPGSGSISGYQWLKNGTAIAGANSASYAAASTGSYTVVVSNSNGCSASSNAIGITSGVAPSISGIDVYIQAFTSAASCSAAVAYNNVTISGSPAPAVSYTFTGATTATGSGTGSGSLFNKGVTHVTITAANMCNTTSASFDVTVVDNVKPVAQCKPATVFLNAAGKASVTAAQLDNGSFDNCSPVSISLGAEGTACGSAAENGTITITVPAGSVIDRVDFASYGTPDGSCGNYTYGWCHSSISESVIRNLALGKSTFTVVANNATFGDPCGGTVKRMYIQVHYTGAAASELNCSKLGANNVTLYVRDAEGNVGTCTSVVTVVDAIAPVPNVATLPVLSGECSVTAIAPTATDNCSGTVTATTTDATSFTQQGTYTINWIFKDASGNSTPQVQTVVVKDVTPPVLQVPADMVVASNAGSCDATVSFAATATDNCTPVTITYSQQPGTIFPVGTTTVQVLARDANNNTTSGSFTVTVQDRTAPVPQVAALAVVTGECSATVAAPQATDNCSGILTATTADPVSYSAQGTYTIHWVYTDAAGNTSTQDQTVIVKDVTPPVIACAFNITVNADPNSCGAVVSYDAPSATDNCGSGTLPTTLAGYTYKGTFGGHTYFLSNSATNPEDAHAKAIALGGHLVTISNAQENAFVSAMSPSFIWIGHTDRQTEGNFKWVTSEPVNYTNWNNGEPNNYGGNEDWAVINWGPNGTWNDWFYYENALYVVEFEGGNIPTTRIAGLGSGATFPIGTTTETWKAVDAGGNIATCSFTVTVVDNQDPTIVGLPANIIVSNDPGVCGARVTWTPPTSADNCTGHSISQYFGPAPGSVFPIGTTGINYRAVDASGRSVTAMFTVTVRDTEAPKLVGLPNNLVVECDAVPAAPTVTATDNCGTGPVIFTETRTNGNCPSTYRLTRSWTVNDMYGNTTTASRLVIVRDTKAPNLTVRDVTATNDAGQCGAIVSFAAQASDNCGSAAIVYSQNPGTYFPVGATTVTATATDACGNQTVKTFVVTVNDTEAPVVRTQNLTIQLDAAGAASITAADVNNASSDNCAIATISVDKDAFSCANVGNNTVTLTVTDIHGNTASATAIVTVEDKVAPVITCPGDVTLNCQDDNTTAATGVATATDACGVASISHSDVSTQNADISNAAHYNYTITRTWTAIDNNGNRSSCIQTITVRDITAPVIACPGNTTVNCDGDASTKSNGQATATDNCAPETIDYADVSTQSTDINNAAHYNYTITRTWTATDVSGNSSQCVQVITVRDVTAPVITNVSGDLDRTVECSDPQAIAAALALAPAATDNCAPVAIHLASDVTTANCGTTYTRVRKWNFTDVTGNTSATFTQTINVVDRTAPAITANANAVEHCFDSTANNYPVPALAATDNCNAVTYSFVVKNQNGGTVRSGNTSNASGSFPVGMNTIYWTVKDACGNTTPAQTTVRINAPITASFSSFQAAGGNANTLYTSEYAPAASANITITANGGTPAYSYAWSIESGSAATILSGAATATINVKAVGSGTVVLRAVITDSKGCQAIFRKTIWVIDARCGNKGDKVLVCHGTGSASNPWVQICVAPSAVPAQLGNGSYLGACTGATTRTIQSAPATEVVEDASVLAYPNPSKGIVQLRLTGMKGALQIAVIDSRGTTVVRKVATVNSVQESLQLDLQGVAAGIYTARISDGKRTLTARIVIAR